MTEDIQASGSEREWIRDAIRIKSAKLLDPPDGVGALAQFDAVIPGLLTINNVKLVRSKNSKIRINAPRLRSDGELSVEFQNAAQRDKSGSDCLASR
jgi:hypothetical protein